MRFKEYLKLLETKKEYDNEEEWMDAVKAAHPEHAAKIKFKGRVEGGKATISAEIKDLDKSFGVFDQDENKGIVFDAE